MLYTQASKLCTDICASYGYVHVRTHMYASARLSGSLGSHGAGRAGRSWLALNTMGPGRGRDSVARGAEPAEGIPRAETWFSACDSVWWACVGGNIDLFLGVPAHVCVSAVPWA